MSSVHIITRHPDAAAVASGLQRAGLQVTIVAQEALELAETELDVTAVILDLRDVPEAAFDILTTAYAEAGSAILALVDPAALERVPIDDKVDDFAATTSGGEEIHRRLERVLYRKHGIDGENVVRAGELAVDLANYRITISGEPVVLTFKEYELLRFLAMNRGRVFTREQLLNRVWGYDYYGGARTVDVHVRRIRAKIEIHGLRFIETVRNVGYRLTID